MKNIFESVIRKGVYDLPSMLEKIDSYHIQGQLSDLERQELYALARSNADPVGSVIIPDKIQELEARIRKVEQHCFGSSDLPGSVQTPAEYTVGKWYRLNDQITFEGTVYICTAPDGTICTWSPAEYPAYWETVTT